MVVSQVKADFDSAIKLNKFERKVSAIVLAAGLSSRMGEANKLLLDINGKTLIEHTLQTICQHPFTEVVVVLGHQVEQLEPYVHKYNVKPCFNSEYEKGQMTSVHKGLSSLTKKADGVMVFLSDLPLINHADLIKLRRGFDLCKTGVLAPTYNNQRGNPIILDFEQREDILANDKNLGCKRLLNKHPELVSTIAFDNDHVIVDMDTPEAYQAVLSRLQKQHKQYILLNETNEIS